MKKTIQYTWRVVKSNVWILLNYRGTFYTGAVSSVLWALLSVLSIVILTYQAPDVGGWNRFEILAAQGVYSIVLGLMYTFLSESIKNIGQLVRFGNLDLLITKPMDLQLLVSVRSIRFYQLVRVVMGIILLVFSIRQLHLQPEPITLLTFILFIVASMTVIYSIWFAMMTLSFWFVDLFNLWEFLQHLTGITRYPLVIMRNLGESFLYILLPLVVITSVPAQVIVGKFDLGLSMWALIIAASAFLLSRKFWIFALRFYTSASS